MAVNLGPADTLVRVPLSRGRRVARAELMDNYEVLPRVDVDAPTTPPAHRRGNPAAARNAARRFRESREQSGGFGVVGFQPVIAQVSEGVATSATAAVSFDRRYVRVTTSPFISSITDVFTFSFAGEGSQALMGTGGN